MATLSRPRLVRDCGPLPDDRPAQHQDRICRQIEITHATCVQELFEWKPDVMPVNSAIIRNTITTKNI
jgi:hypothetical protein